MTVMQPTELSQAETKRGAAVLLYLLDWQKGFCSEEAVRSLREAKLDAAIVVTTNKAPRVHEAVLEAFCNLAGRSAVWDSAKENCRARRKDDPA